MVRRHPAAHSARRIAVSSGPSPSGDRSAAGAGGSAAGPVMTAGTRAVGPGDAGCWWRRRWGIVGGDLCRAELRPVLLPQPEHLDDGLIDRANGVLAAPGLATVQRVAKLVAIRRVLARALVEELGAGGHRGAG